MYVAHEDASHETDLSLEFRTLQSTGLLFLARGRLDFCLLELRDGQLVVRIELGSGEARLLSTPGVFFNDFQWHHVHLTRANERVSPLTVNNFANLSILVLVTDVKLKVTTTK